MSLDHRELHYFGAVYEERSISRAAVRANVVQTAVSAQFQALEEELAVRLFERSS